MFFYICINQHPAFLLFRIYNISNSFPSYLKFQKIVFKILRDCNIQFSYSSECLYIKVWQKSYFSWPSVEEKETFTKTWLCRLPMTTAPLDLSCNWYLSCTSNKVSSVTGLQTIILPDTNDNGYSVTSWG